MKSINLNAGIRLVMLQVQPDLRVSKPFAIKLDELMTKILKKIVTNARECMKSCRRIVLDAKDIQASLRLSLDPHLAKFSVADGTKAVVKFSSYSDKDKSTRAHKAGLAISVSTVEKSMRSLLPKKIRKIRLSQSSIIYTTAALEHIIAEIADIARLLLPLDKRTLTAEVFDATLAHDAALGNLLKCTTILYR